MKLDRRGSGRYHRFGSLVIQVGSEITGKPPFVNRSLGRWISVAFVGPDFYALGCHKRSFLGNRVYCDIANVEVTGLRGFLRRAG